MPEQDPAAMLDRANKNIERLCEAINNHTKALVAAAKFSAAVLVAYGAEEDEDPEAYSDARLAEIDELAESAPVEKIVSGFVDFVREVSAKKRRR